MLHTDQGSNFESRLFTSLCKLLGIVKTRTTPHHPQSDGFVERANKTVQIAVRSYVDKDPSRCDVHLPLVQLAYNTSVHSVTGFTPYFVLFGREANLPLTLLYPSPEEQHISAPEYVSALRNKLAACFNLIRTRLEVIHKVAKKSYDQNANAPTWREGDYLATLCSPGGGFA